eukprot:Lithocolla_globosa_v1_NODE_7468_length_943_cov_1.843468.p1 type:complete len:271 gc:universal NODE_7468_length_943_cov_1.843468:885-73(-)
MDDRISEEDLHEAFLQMVQQLTPESVMGILQKNIDKSKLVLTGFSSVDETHVRDVVGLTIAPRALTRWKFAGNLNVEPSEWLTTGISKLHQVWSLNCEATRRTLIDLFLIDVLSNQEDVDQIRHLRAFGEVPLKWVEGRIGVHGPADYGIGFSELVGDKIPQEIFLFILEAKKDWPGKSVWQLLAQAGAVRKEQISKGKTNTTVYAVLSNGEFWQFFQIGEDGAVIGSPRYDIEMSVQEVYRHLFHVIQLAGALSAPSSPAQSKKQKTTD